MIDDILMLAFFLIDLVKLIKMWTYLGFQAKIEVL